jgi:hypothetical protein
MVTERSDASRNYPSLPMRETRERNSARPTINVQMDEVSKQLAQVISELQRLNHQMQALQEEKRNIQETGSYQKENDTPNDRNNVRKYQSADVALKSFGRRRRLSKRINSIFIFFLVAGIATALFAAIILFFHGPSVL